MIVKIPDENSELATRLPEKLGAEISEKKFRKKKFTTEKGMTKSHLHFKKERKQKLSDWFGKWKDIELDPLTFTEKIWDRSQKF